MSEREEDLDGELEELVDTDGYPDVETASRVEDLEAEVRGDLDEEVAEPGLEAGRDSLAGSPPAGGTGGETTFGTTERTQTDAVASSRARSWFGSLFSTRWFGAAALASGVGVIAVGAIPLPFTGYLGVLLAGAVVGLATRERRYLEVATAGALAAGLATVFDALVLVALGVGVPLVTIAAFLGAVAGAVGHYAGRDVRHGLTREL
jgi:hypothetical protein